MIDTVLARESSLRWNSDELLFSGTLKLPILRSGSKAATTC